MKIKVGEKDSLEARPGKSVRIHATQRTRDVSEAHISEHVYY